MTKVRFVVALLLATGCSSPDARGTDSRATSTTGDAESTIGFVPTADVDALDQPNGHETVGKLRRGETYPILKRGGPEKRWCKVTVDGSTTGWVLCEGATARDTSRTDSTSRTDPSRGTATTDTTREPPGPSGDNGREGDFAYYVLTLSWSPAFCHTPAGAKSEEQCATGSGSRHYGFVVHGLWPQNEKGYPEHCGNGAGPSPTLVTSLLDIMPSEHLIHHEWETHGTCSGLDSNAYFAKLRAAFESVRIPKVFVRPADAFTTSLDEVVRAFTSENPGLAREDMSVQCKGELSEVRLCLDKSLKPRACGSDVKSNCRGSVTVPPVR